jgi:hypothetical protein
VRDLLPLYAEGLLSDESCELVKKHLEECEDCQKELESIKKDITISTPNEQAKIFEAFISAMKKYKEYIYTLVFGALIFSMMVIVGFGAIDMFLMAAFMIPVGFWGYIFFRKHAFYMIPLITAVSFISCIAMRFVLVASDIEIFIGEFLLYSALFILPSFLGIATGALTHSIFKKRTKGVILKRVISGILAVIFLCLSFFAFFIITGNPIITISSMFEAKEYLDERFEHNDYFPYKVRYDCVFSGEYIVYVTSISDDDVKFKITFSPNGEMRSCDYDKKYKSDKQSLLSAKYVRLTDNAIYSSDFSYEIVKTKSYYTFPYEKHIPDSFPNALTMEDFNLRTDYDLSELGKTNGIILVEVSAKNLSKEQAAKIYLELRSILDENGVGFKTLRINLVNPETERKVSFKSVKYEDITSSRIYSVLEQLERYAEIK